MKLLTTLLVVATGAALFVVPAQEPPPPAASDFVHQKYYVQTVPLSLEQRAQLATEIVHARILGSRSFFPANRPAYTEYDLEVLIGLKASAPQPTVVRVPGARNESKWTDFPQAPRFLAGEEVALFLHLTEDGDYILLGLSEGVRRVRLESDGSRTVLGPSGENVPLGAFLDFLLAALVVPAPVH